MNTVPRAPVSVVIATYNGERFIAEQLRSILLELGPEDEVLVLDDGSWDRTVAILESFQDPRVRIEHNPVNLGHPQAFGRAVAMARHGTIFLSDQDDVWIPGRVERMLSALDRSGADIVASNSEYVNAGGQPMPFPMPPLSGSQSGDRLGNLARIFAGRAGYYGCAMALRAEFRALALPVPRFIEAHDLWFALLANAFGHMCHLEEATLHRRIHGSNVSVVKRRLAKRVRARARFVAALLLGAARRLKHGATNRP